MSLAGVFIEHDGGPTITDLLMLVALFAAVLAAAWLVSRVSRRERQAVWARWMAALQDKASANSSRIERLASHVERETRIVCEMRSELTGADANSQPALKVIKGS